MALIDQVRSEMMAAMKEKNTIKKEALSALLAALKSKAIDKRADLTPEEEIAEKLTLKTVLSSLEEMEQKLIELRYFKGLTQVKTAKELGMSQVQVSRKEKAILLKMRKMM